MKISKSLLALTLLFVIVSGCKKSDTVVQNAILLYPNPARDVVSVDFNFPNTGSVKLELIGNSNKPLYSAEVQTSSSLNLNVSSYPNGVYKLIGTQNNVKSITTLYIQRPN
jgi:lysyl endopeptidase